MKKYPVLTEFVEGRGYTHEEWNEADFPEMSDEELAKMRPLKEALPWLHEAVQKAKNGRGLQKKPTKIQISMRLDQDVVQKFKATGEGWQTRINAILKQATV